MDADVAMNPNTKRQVSKAPIHEVSYATLGTGTRNCKLKFCEKSIKQTGNIPFMGRMPVCRRHGILKVLDSCRNCDRMIFDRCIPVAKFFGMDHT